MPERSNGLGRGPSGLVPSRVQNGAAFAVHEIHVPRIHNNIKMVKRTGPTNVNLKSLISELNKLGVKEKSNLWKRLAFDLSKPTRQRREINVEKINKYAREGEIVVVPGKVLAEGDADKKLTVAAWTFSEAAKAKISKKGKTMTIAQLMKENPQGKKVRILG